MQHILSTVRQAVDKYDMIEENDTVAVGLSGGKDSIALLASLDRLKNFYPKKFSVVGISVDMGFDDAEDIYAPVREFCAEHEIPYHIEKTKIKEIVFDVRKEKNPCSLCAKLRRGALVSCARELGAGKLALGHHLDDAAETFMLTLVNEGRVGCYSPVTVYEDTAVTVIRPLIYTREADIRSLVKKENLPVVKSPCPEDGNTDRAEIKNVIRELEINHRGLKKRIITAMEKRGLDGWQ